MHRTETRIIVTSAIAAIIAIVIALILVGDTLPTRQVIIDGKVVTWQSMLSSCRGDSTEAAALSNPVRSAGSYLSKGMIITEHLYNTMHIRFLPFLASVGVLLLIVLFPRRHRMWCTLMCIILGGVLAVTCVLSGRIPMAAIGESMICAAFILSAILLTFRSRRLSLVTEFFVCLLLGGASVMWVHPAVWQPVASLQSWWLPLHVTVMMTSYSLLILSAAAAIAGISDRILHRLLYTGTICLACGILTGSLWAAEAWGRLWAWDPKETFAFITLLVYMLLLTGWRHISQRSRHIFTILALISVIVTWLGIAGLGGLHSY